LTESDFNCLKCGTCCRNILEDINGRMSGLILTPKESELFPCEVVSPKMAIGMNEPKIILLNQLNSNNCPHISEKSIGGLHEMPDFSEFKDLVGHKVTEDYDKMPSNYRVILCVYPGGQTRKHKPNIERSFSKIRVV
jgi:hypothetical protein